MREKYLVDLTIQTPNGTTFHHTESVTVYHLPFRTYNTYTKEQDKAKAKHKALTIGVTRFPGCGVQAERPYQP